MGYLCVYFVKKMRNMRILNHFGGNHVWALFIYILFVMALLFSAYLFWWHNHTYVSYLVRREVNEEEENIEV